MQPHAGVFVVAVVLPHCRGLQSYDTADVNCTGNGECVFRLSSNRACGRQIVVCMGFLLLHLSLRPLRSGSIQRLQTALLGCLALGATLSLPQALLQQTSATSASAVDSVLDGDTQAFVVTCSFVVLFGVPAMALAGSVVPKRHFAALRAAGVRLLRRGEPSKADGSASKQRAALPL